MTETKQEEIALESGDGDPSAPPYSSFTQGEKRYIVFLIAFASWFSIMSSFIFFLVIPLLAKGISTSIENINLTVTSYLIVSGLAPFVVGDAADMMGRRPVYIITMFLYFIANVGFAVQSSFRPCSYCGCFRVPG